MVLRSYWGIIRSSLRAFRTTRALRTKYVGSRVMNRNSSSSRKGRVSGSVSSKAEEDLMVLVAWMYYDENLTQQQIAQRLDLSPVKVTRLLQKARLEHIVEMQVKITRPLPLESQVAWRLRERFGLKEAILVRTYESLSDTLDAVGAAGAAQLNKVLTPQCRVGVVGWSNPVRRMARYVQAADSKGPCIVNELLGSFLGEVSSYNMSAQIANALGAPLETLPVPVVVQSKAARDAMLREPGIRISFEHARKCDVAVVGLGHMNENWTVVDAGQMTASQVETLRNAGVAGDIILRFYDHNGSPVQTELDDRVMSLDWEDIRRIPYIIAMACGSNKVDSIAAALRGNLFHCLITDTATGQQVLERADSWR